VANEQRRIGVAVAIARVCGNGPKMSVAEFETRWRATPATEDILPLTFAKATGDAWQRDGGSTTGLEACGPL
jgi:hypothetical protein